MHVFVVPSCVITNVAVADPLNVITSRRVDVFVVPSTVITTFIDRVTVPAVGYVGRPFSTGIVKPDVVSPIVREAVNALPSRVVPAAFSEPCAVPFTVRSVLPAAVPVTVRSELLATVAETLSRRCTVPLAVMRVRTVLVVLSCVACAAPFAVVNVRTRVIVMPPRVIGAQVTSPVAAENVQLLASPVAKGP